MFGYSENCSQIICFGNYILYWKSVHLKELYSKYVHNAKIITSSNMLVQQLFFVDASLNFPFPWLLFIIGNIWVLLYNSSRTINQWLKMEIFNSFRIYSKANYTEFPMILRRVLYLCYMAKLQCYYSALSPRDHGFDDNRFQNDGWFHRVSQTCLGQGPVSGTDRKGRGGGGK